jgi:hypothetical protein
MRKALGNRSLKHKREHKLTSIAQMLNEAEEIADLIESIKEKLGQREFLIKELEEILSETEHLIESKMETSLGEHYQSKTD